MGQRRVQDFVRDNNVDQALEVLKRKMQREGVLREMKLQRSAALASSPAKSCSVKVCCR
jgi:Ribosomal protein S21